MHLTNRLRFFVILYSIVFSLIALIIFSNLFEMVSADLATTLISVSNYTSPAVGKLSMYYEILIACIISLLPSLYFINADNSRASTLILTTATGIFIVAWVLLVTNNLLIPIIHFELALLIGTGAAILLKMVLASSQANFLRLAFSQFVSEPMLKDLMRNPEKLKLQGKEADITVLFLDIRGFTSYSEHNQPSIVVHMLNDLLDRVTNIIFENKGTVDKFMGDAVMAMWGAPQTDTKQATNAVLAAIKIKETIFRETQFRVGIGITYGHAIVGNMGASRKFDYTAIGDTVNTASRLEKSTKDLGETIVISNAVKKKLEEEKSDIKTKDLGEITLKGKREPVHVYGIDTLD